MNITDYLKASKAYADTETKAREMVESLAEDDCMFYVTYPIGVLAKHIGPIHARAAEMFRDKYEMDMQVSEIGHKSYQIDLYSLEDEEA